MREFKYFTDETITPITVATTNSKKNVTLTTVREHDLAAVTSQTQMGALPAEEATEREKPYSCLVLLLIQRYRTESRRRRRIPPCDTDYSAGRTDTVFAACAAAGSGVTNYLRHPSPSWLVVFMWYCGVRCAYNCWSVGAPAPS